MSMFVWTRDDLSEEQERAILHPGNVLLVACPGSGKTRTLTFKIALELSRLKSGKHFVIAITYTNRAAEEIKERIELLGVDTTQLWIGTIHAFCFEWILKPYHLYSNDLQMGFRIINPHDSDKLLTELCVPYERHNVTIYDCSYIVGLNGAILTCPRKEKHPHIRKILQGYWEILSERRQIDFQLILYFSLELLRDKKFISSCLSKIFSYVLLDEYQDTSGVQYEILLKIVKSGNKALGTFIVGDPNQSIYTNLGGYPIAIEDLRTRTGCEFTEFSLSENYRSSEVIIGYFDHFKTFPNDIIGKGKHSTYGSIISYNNLLSRNDLVDEIARLIKFNVDEKGISPNEICVVAPQWVHLASLTRSLMVKLPEFSFDGPGMAPFARDIENFFYKLCRVVLTEPSPDMYVRRIRWSGEVLSDLGHFGIDTSAFDRKRLLKICNSIVIDETEGIPFLKKFIDELFVKLNIGIEANQSLAEHYASFFKSSQERITRLVNEGYSAISSIESFRKVFRQKDGITISTIHGVKGAEFDVVIAFALLEDYIPHFSDQNKLDSASKLLYVICSRARKNLHLISEKGRLKNFGNPRPEYVPTNRLLSYGYNYDVC
jgi:DNA helicase-2/ATP-dependent DNA helicase PcrA